MNPSDYTPEMQKDITERVQQALKALAELSLKHSSSISAVNTGDDVFALKVMSYLQDTKYTPQVSPVQKKDL